MVNLADRACEEADPDAGALDARRRALRDCLRRLPLRSRSLLERRYVQDADSTELARRFARSAAVVRMTLLRIRKALFECVRKRLSLGTAP